MTDPLKTKGEKNTGEMTFKDNDGNTRKMDTKMEAADTNVSASGAYEAGAPNAPDGIKTTGDAPANLHARGKVIAADKDVDLANAKTAKDGNSTLINDKNAQAQKHR
jgi:hypothetical protein